MRNKKSVSFDIILISNAFRVALVLLLLAGVFIILRKFGINLKDDVRWELYLFISIMLSYVSARDGIINTRKDNRKVSVAIQISVTLLFIANVVIILAVGNGIDFPIFKWAIFFVNCIISSVAEYIGAEPLLEVG